VLDLVCALLKHTHTHIYIVHVYTYYVLCTYIIYIYYIYIYIVHSRHFVLHNSRLHHMHMCHTAHSHTHIIIVLAAVGGETLGLPASGAVRCALSWVRVCE